MEEDRSQEPKGGSEDARLKRDLARFVALGKPAYSSVASNVTRRDTARDTGKLSRQVALRGV